VARGQRGQDFGQKNYFIERQKRRKEISFAK
jgi:hypothetical protein